MSSSVDIYHRRVKENPDSLSPVPKYGGLKVESSEEKLGAFHTWMEALDEYIRNLSSV